MTRVVLKWSKWLSLSFGGILLALLLAIGFLLFTKPGLGVILWAGEKFVPQLNVASYSGALLPRFTLNQVEFVDPELGIDSKINAVTLGINSTCLTEASVCIDELAIDGLAFSLPELPPQTEAEPVQESAPMGNITTPIPVKVGRIALSNIDLNVLGNQISWERFTTALSFQGNRLQVSKTELNKIHIALAETAPSDAEPQPEKTGEPSAIVLPDVVLPLQVDLVRLDIRDFKLQQATPIIVHHLGLQASAAGSNVSVPTLELDMPQVQGKLNAKVTLKQDYPLSLQLDATVKDPMAKGQKLSLVVQPQPMRAIWLANPVGRHCLCLTQTSRLTLCSIKPRRNGRWSVKGITLLTSTICRVKAHSRVIASTLLRNYRAKSCQI